MLADRIVKIAWGYNGSKAWAVNAEKDNFAKGSNKCNKFVYDVIVEAGGHKPLVFTIALADPLFGVPLYSKYRPPLAREWENPKTIVTGWEVVTTPEPGDVASYQGHCGIVVGPNLTASATFDAVVVNDWGFRPGQTPTFRRHQL